MVYFSQKQASTKTTVIEIIQGLYLVCDKIWKDHRSNESSIWDWKDTFTLQMNVTFCIIILSFIFDKAIYPEVLGTGDLHPYLMNKKTTASSLEASIECSAKVLKSYNMSKRL